jgi:hypothetical protein
MLQLHVAAAAECSWGDAAAYLHVHIASAYVSAASLCIRSTVHCAGEAQEAMSVGLLAAASGGISNKQPCAAAFLVWCCTTLGARFVFALNVQPPPPSFAFEGGIEPPGSLQLVLCLLVQMACIVQPQLLML